MAGDNVVGFPGKNAQQNAGAKMPGKMPGQMPGAAGDHPIRSVTAVLGPTGVVGMVRHYQGVLPDGVDVSVWVVEPPTRGYSAISMRG